MADPYQRLTVSELRVLAAERGLPIAGLRTYADILPLLRNAEGRRLDRDEGREPRDADERRPEVPLVSPAPISAPGPAPRARPPERRITAAPGTTVRRVPAPRVPRVPPPGTTRTPVPVQEPEPRRSPVRIPSPVPVPGSGRRSPVRVNEGIDLELIPFLLDTLRERRSQGPLNFVGTQRIAGDILQVTPRTPLTAEQLTSNKYRVSGNVSPGVTYDETPLYAYLLSQPPDLLLGAMAIWHLSDLEASFDQYINLYSILNHPVAYQSMQELGQEYGEYYPHVALALSRMSADELASFLPPGAEEFNNDRTLMVGYILGGYLPMHLSAVPPEDYAVVQEIPSRFLVRLLKPDEFPGAPYYQVARKVTAENRQYLNTLLQIPDEDLDFWLETWQLSPRQDPEHPLSADRKRVYIWDAFVDTHYARAVNRDPATLPPPPLSNDVAMDALYVYTDVELIRDYEVTAKRTRKVLLRAILQLRDVGSKWSFQHGRCRNTEEINILLQEPRGPMTEDVPEDPILSYGLRGNYNCYSASELVGAFDMYTVEDNGEEQFVFQIPGWEPLVMEDERTRYREQHPELARGSPELEAAFRADFVPRETQRNLEREFPLSSIRQLKRLLTSTLEQAARGAAEINVTEEGLQVLRDLLEKVNQGLDASNAVTRALTGLKTRFHDLSEEDQGIVQLFVVWMFFYSMWLRFWKGPPHDYPYRWVDNDQYGRMRGQEFDPDRCTATNREEHSTIQRAIMNDILAMSPTAREFIETLPVIKKKKGTTNLVLISVPGQLATLMEFLNRAFGGQLCLGFTSIFTYLTSWELIIRVLGITPEVLDRLLNVHLQTLLQIEKTLLLGFRNLPEADRLEEMARAPEPLRGILENLQRIPEAEREAYIAGLDPAFQVIILGLGGVTEEVRTERLAALNQPFEALPPFQPENIVESWHYDVDINADIQQEE